MPTITHIIPMAVQSGNIYAKRQWYAANNYKKKWYRTLSWYFPERDRCRVKMRVTIKAYLVRRFDEENYHMGCKPIFDHLKKAGYLFDDTPNWVERVYEQYADGKNVRTEITIEEVTP